MSEVGALIIRLQAETAQFRQDMGKVKSDLNDLKGGAENASGGLDKFGGSAVSLRTQLGLVDNVVRGRLPMALADLVRAFASNAAVMDTIPFVAVIAGIAAVALIAAEGAKKLMGMADGNVKLLEATHAVDSEFNKQHDELMALNEAYIGMTQGSVAEYAQKLKDLGNESLDMTGYTKTLTAELDEQSSTWDWIKAKTQDYVLVLGMYGDVVGHIWMATGDAMMLNFKGAAAEMKALKDEVNSTSVTAYSANDAEKAIKIINEKIEKNNDLKAAMAAVTFEIGKANNAYNAEIAAGRYVDSQHTGQALTELSKEKELIAGKQAVIDAKARNIRQQEADAGAGAAEKHNDELAKQADLIAKITKLQNELSAVPPAPAFETDADAAQAAADRDAAIKKAQDDYNANKGKTGAYQAMLDAKKDADLTYQATLLGIELKGANDYIKLTADAEKSAMDARKAVDEDFIKGYLQTAKDVAQQAADAYEEADKQRQQTLKDAQSAASTNTIGAFDPEAAKRQEQKADLAALLASEQALKNEIAAIQKAMSDPRLAGTDQYRELNKLLIAAKDNLKELQDQSGKTSKQLDADALTWQNSVKNAGKQAEDAFNNSFTQWVLHGGSAYKMLESLGEAFVGSMVQQGLKMLENWIHTEVTKLTVHKVFTASMTATTVAGNAAASASSQAADSVNRLSAAKTAAAKAMTTVPFPLDLIVAPIVFAAALAFAGGGIVPGAGYGDSVPAYLTPGEGVFPVPVMQKLAAATEGGNHYHMHYSPTNHIQAWDGDSVKDAFLAQKGEFIKQAKKEMRRAGKR